MKFLRLKYKIAFYFILLILSFSVVSSSVFLSREYKAEIANYKSACSSVLKNIEPNVAELLYVNDVVELRRVVEGIKQSNKDFVYCFVLNADKKVVVHTFSNNFPSALLSVNTVPVQNSELLDFGDSMVYDFSYPVVAGKLGIIRVGVSRERLVEELNGNLVNRIIILVLFILLGIVTAFYLSKRITNPLSELVASAERISEGDFDHLVRTTSNDEIGKLSVSFNTMCGSLKNITKNLESKIKQLNETNEEYLALNEEYQTQNQELLMAKEIAEECDRLKTAFLANLSHEIRTPMNGILGFAELLKSRDISKDTQAEYISVIEQSGQRMLNLISDLIDISRIEAGQIRIANEKTEIDKLLEKIYSFFKPQASQKGIELILERPVRQNSITLMTDPLKLEQVISNLISNSLKFTSKGKIQLGYEIKDNMLQFSIKDTGKGIPEGMKEAIFERFRQVEDVRHKSEEGSGLGLAICKSFIGLMGGTIWVESEIEKGSAFYFTIPYISADNENDLNKNLSHKTGK